MNTNASRTLAEFFTEVVKPLIAFRNQSTRKYYRRVVRLFHEFLGKPQVTIGEITPQNLIDFDAWLTETLSMKGVPNPRGRRLDYYFDSVIRAILNAADPDRFKRRINESAKKRQDVQAIPPAPKTAPVEGSLLHFFENTYRPKRLRGKAPNTSVQYRMTVARFGKFLGRTPLLTDLTDDQVTAFLLWRRESTGVAAPTVNKDRCQLLSLGNLAARKRLIEFLEVQIEDEPEIIPQAWTRGQLATLFEACRKTKGSIGGVLASAWWHTLHSVAFDTGERITALLGLRWEYLDLETGWLRVPAELRKGRRKPKAFRLHPDTLTELRAIQLPERDVIFPWPYCRTYIWYRYRKIRRRANLPTDRKSAFHRMRKSVASHFKAAGGDPTALLGHSDSRVTEAYLDPSIVVEQQAIDLLFRPDAPQAPPPPPKIDPETTKGGEAAPEPRSRPPASDE